MIPIKDNYALSLLVFFVRIVTHHLPSLPNNHTTTIKWGIKHIHQITRPPTKAYHTKYFCNICYVICDWNIRKHMSCMVGRQHMRWMAVWKYMSDIVVKHQMFRIFENMSRIFGILYLESSSSSSSSYRAGSTDIPDPLSPLIPIVPRPR